MNGTPERYKFFGVIFLLIVLSFVFSQEIFAQTGTLTGFVKAEGGQGIENILVNVSSIMPAQSYLGSTDSNGQYTITGITPGEYIVYFSVGMMNYVPEYYDNQNISSWC